MNRALIRTPTVTARCYSAASSHDAAMLSNATTRSRANRAATVRERPRLPLAYARGSVTFALLLIVAYAAAIPRTPEQLEALSWQARDALKAKQLDAAAKYAGETRRLAEAELKTRKLDAEPHLPIALGAAIEVQSQVLAARGHRDEAVANLRRALALYGNTSIATRIQKNINLLTLEGHRAPALVVTEHLGPQPPSLAALKGRPALLFFWAHWCGDCKAEAPLIAELRREYAPKGLVVIAPTQRYGYTAADDNATPAQELAFIENVRHRYYGGLLDVPVPVSAANLRAYGVSTTPTLVFIARSGVVTLYHPGAMTLPELRAAADAALRR